LIDLHCHILHGVDDGPQSLEESLSMARAAVNDGIHSVVATPHTLNGIHLNRVEEVISKVATLQNILSENQIELKVYAGADVHLCPRLLERIESGDACTIGNRKKYLLLEFPPQVIPAAVRDEVLWLKLNGITPITTHSERNTVIQHNVDFLYELVSMGALIQVTAMSITGNFGGLVMQWTESLLRYRLVHMIASDAHSADRRPPILSHAVHAAAEILGSYEEAYSKVNDVPACILSGGVLEVLEPFHAKQGRGCV
jgi:protein-tyrosine phosphatase